MEVDGSQSSLKKVKIKFNKTKLDVPLPSVANNNDESPSPPPSPEHFLEIIPKPTLLGKEQAKKRLQAFSQTKTLLTSPIKKKSVKSPKILECVEEKYDEDGRKTEEIAIIKKPPKRSINHDAKYKNIIEEIEMLKKKETVILKEALYKANKNSRSFESKSTPDRGSKKKNDVDYPSGWGEMKKNKLSLNDVKQMGLMTKVYSSSRHVDATKMLNFKLPNFLLTPVKCRYINGKDEYVPGSFIRYTSASPKISYSINSTKRHQCYFSRSDVFASIPRSQLDLLRSFIQQSEKLSKKLSTPCLERKWYSKNALQNVDSECQILEASLGLSFLQNYTDEDDEVETVSTLQENVINDCDKPSVELGLEKGSLEEEKRKEDDSEQSCKKNKKAKRAKLKVKKKKKKDERKRKHLRKKAGKDKNNVIKISEDASKQSKRKMLNNDKSVDNNIENDYLHQTNLHKAVNNVDSSKGIQQTEVPALAQEILEEIDSESNEEFKLTKSPTRLNEVLVMNEECKDKHCSKIEKGRLKCLKNVEGDYEDTNELQVSSSKKIDESLRNEIGLDLESKINLNSTSKKCNTPDTDEYHSHWESDDELETTKETNKTDSWESDEEKFKCPVKPEIKHVTPQISERSLEMPLNITITRNRKSDVAPKLSLEKIPNYLFTKDSWENPEVVTYKDLELKQLEEARRTLSEERKLLEVEKQKIAEIQKRISQQEPQFFELLKTEDIKKEKNVDNFLLPPEESKRKSRKCRWEATTIKQEKEEELIPEKDILENQYEQFIKAVTEEVSEEAHSHSSPAPAKTAKKQRKRKYSSSSENSSRSSSRTDGSLKHDANNFENIKLPPLPVLPVPSPSITNDLKITTVYGKTVPVQCETSPRCRVDSTSSPSKPAVEFKDELDLRNRKPISSIVLTKKNNVLTSHIFDNSDDSCGEGPVKVDAAPKNLGIKSPLTNDADNLVKTKAVSPKWKRNSPNRSYSPKKSKPRREFSPFRRHKGSPNRSPRFRYSSPGRDRNSSPRFRNYSPRRDVSPRRHHSPRRDYSPRRNLSPRRLSPRRNLSPRRDYSPRRASPRRRNISPKRDSFKRRDLSPWRDRSPRRNRSLSPKYRSPPRRKETIQETLSRLAGISSFDAQKKSPVNSPVDGFRKSLADSTISDEQLLQNREQFLESPVFYNKIESNSPKRMPLDERINQVLGINKEEPKPISTTYSQNYPCNPNYYEQYDQFSESQYRNKNNDVNMVKPLPPTKVLQVGNMLQVVPIEDVTTTIAKVVDKPKEEVKQKIVQVGNMLQIVPTQILPPSTNTAEISVREKQSAEELMKAKIASRMAEREKRIQARISRKIEKEKKQAEREKRKALKIKQKTEEMIKKALLLELEEDDGNPVDNVIPTIIMNNTLRAGKGILISKRSNILDDKNKKGVKFADGILPGEGTSTSGAEELSSPPPLQFITPKDKRYTKTKKRNKHSKKKLKTKIRKKKVLDDVDYESLPPPSPPPGSPPPNVFPPRIKHTNTQYLPVNMLQSPNLCKTPNDSSQYQSGHYTLPQNRPQTNQPQSFLMHQVQNVNIPHHPPPNLIQHNSEVIQSTQSLTIYNPALPPPIQHSHLQQRLPFPYQRTPVHLNQSLPQQPNSFMSTNHSTRVQGTPPLHKKVQRMIPGIDSPGQTSNRALQAGQLYPSGISPPQIGMQRQGNN